MDFVPDLSGKTPGERLREIREALGLTLRGASERAGTISHVTITNVENMPGTLEGVAIGTLDALARAYKIDLMVIVAIALGQSISEVETDHMIKLVRENQKLRRALDDIRAAVRDTDLEELS